MSKYAVWPPDDARVVRITPSHLGHPSLYVAQVGVVVSPAGISKRSEVATIDVQLRDGSVVPVLASRCTTTSGYAVRQSERRVTPPRTQKKRPHAINPRYGTELEMEI